MHLTFEESPDLRGSRSQVLSSLLGMNADCSALLRSDLNGCMDQEIVDALDEMTHLMNGYLTVGEVSQLEPVMHLQAALLRQASDRYLKGTDITYYEAWYLRIQACAYGLKDQKQNAADFYYRFAEAEKRCFHQMKDDPAFTEEQKKYTAWMCLRGLREAQRAMDALGEEKRSREILQRCGRRAEWLMPKSAGDYELLRRLTEVYSGLGGPMYFHGSPQIGSRYFDKAIAMFRYLARTYGSNHCLIMAVWTKALWATQESMYRNNHRLLLECRSELRRILSEISLGPADQAIASAAKGITAAQMGNYLMLIQREQKGLKAAQQSCRQLRSALLGINSQLQSLMDCSERGTLQAIGSHVFGCYAGALDTLGVLYYENGLQEEAKGCLQQALQLLDTQSQYYGVKTMSDQIRAECCEYLGLIFNDQQDGEQALSYFEYATVYAKASSLKERLPVLIFSSHLAAEILLSQKEKNQAAYYADTGLTACRELEELEPDNSILSLKVNLEKILKKTRKALF